MNELREEIEKILGELQALHLAGGVTHLKIVDAYRRLATDKLEKLVLSEKGKLLLEFENTLLRIKKEQIGED